MNFDQRVAACEALYRIAQHACVRGVIPNAFPLGVDHRDQIVDIIDNQFEKPQIPTEGPFFNIFS
jgi:myo-inositol catabolism protein IolC